MAIFAPLIAVKPFEDAGAGRPEQGAAMAGLALPDHESHMPRFRHDYPLGADYVGRDLFSRIVYGARVSLTVAFIGPLISLIIGVIYGSISGYFGGRVDNIMMRIVDVLYAFPSLLFIILLMAFFRSTLVRHSSRVPLPIR